MLNRKEQKKKLLKKKDGVFIYFWIFATRLYKIINFGIYIWG